MTISTFLALDGQTIISRYDFRLGIGSSLVGRGDVKPIVYENELNYHFSHELNCSISYNYSKSIQSNSMIFHANQFNVNLCFSPFRKITSKGDFRLGAGFSFLNASEVHLQRWVIVNGQVTERYYSDPDIRFNYGFNYLLEYSHVFLGKLLVGTKVFLFDYKFGDGTDIISGFVLKLGYCIE